MIAAVLISFFIGVLFGMFVMAACRLAGHADREIENMNSGNINSGNINSGNIEQ